MKYHLLLLSLIPFLPSIAKASETVEEDTGYHVFAKYRNFGAKQGINYVYDGIDENSHSVRRYMPALVSSQIGYLKNIGRTFKEAASYGGWDKQFRIISGYERDDTRVKTSRGIYGHKNNADNFFFLADKALDNHNWRWGTGLILSSMDNDFDNHMSQDQDNAVVSLYTIYNNPETKVRFRSMGYLGCGKGELRRKIDEGGILNLDSDADSLYYGFENTLSKTLDVGSFFIQPQIEFNGYGVKRGKIREQGAGVYNLTLPSDDAMNLNTLVGLYSGYNGRDSFGNKYNLKFGPDLTYNLSSAYKSFYGWDEGGDFLAFNKRDDMKSYIAWKAYANYYFSNGVALYADWRYYHKGEDNQAFALGVSYSL